MKRDGLIPVFLFLLVAALPVANARGQITITADDVRAFFRGTYINYDFETGADTVEAHRAALQSLRDQAGPNQTWDLTGIPFRKPTSEVSQVVEPPAPGSDDPVLSTANLIVLSRDTLETGIVLNYNYMYINDTGFGLLGGVSIGEFDENPGPDTTVHVWDPPFAVEKLPIRFGDTWTTSDTLVISEDEEGRFYVVSEETNIVDGWGTLRTPSGQAPALRVRTRDVSVTKIEVPGLPPMEMGRDTSYTIDFRTNARIDATLDMGSDGQVTDVSYSVIQETSVGVEPGQELPERIALGQNYPNPFNPSTTIPFVLEQGGPVRLSVYDVAGRRVAVLVDGTLPAGDHVVNWQATGMPSGLYLYRLEAGGRVENRQMSLVK